MARRAELSCVALTSEDWKQVFKALSEIFAVLIIKFIDLFQEKRKCESRCMAKCALKYHETIAEYAGFGHIRNRLHIQIKTFLPWKFIVQSFVQA